MDLVTGERARAENRSRREGNYGYSGGCTTVIRMTDGEKET